MFLFDSRTDDVSNHTDRGRPQHGVTLICPAGSSGVMDGRDCTRPVVVGWVDARHCVPVRDMSRRAET